MLVVCRYSVVFYLVTIHNLVTGHNLIWLVTFCVAYFMLLVSVPL